MSRRKQCGILFAVILVLFLGYSSQKPDRLLKEITDVIGVDVSTGEVLSEEDSHGGFHGDDLGVLDRASYNFTIAIYDTDNRILYYIEFDT